MALLYADEHFPSPAVAELRRLGHDVLTIHEDGRAGLTAKTPIMPALLLAPRIWISPNWPHGYTMPFWRQGAWSAG